MDLGTVQFLGLYVGGENGTARQNASTAFTGECAMIKVLVDGTTFSVLSAKDQDDATVNMLTANNLTSKVFNAGDLVFCPVGGYFSAYTASEETEYYVMPDSDRYQQRA